MFLLWILNNNYYFYFLILFLLPTLSIPLSGGPGRGLYFDNTRADVIGLAWNNAPTIEITIQFWIKIIDPSITYHTPFAYSTFDAYSSPPQAVPEEIQVAFTGNDTRFCHYSCITCLGAEFPDCAFTYDQGWIHTTTVWRSSTGSVEFYKNGQLTWITPNNSTGQTSIRSGGCIHLGQEPDDFCGGFDSLQALNGEIDELRVWSTALSQSEIASNWNLTIDPLTTGLNLYYRFDGSNQSNSKIISDLSGHGNDGYLGKLPDLKDLMTYSTGQLPQLPTDPFVIQSHAPFIGGVLVFQISLNQTINISIPIYNTNHTTNLFLQIKSVPTLGNLFFMNGSQITINSTTFIPSSTTDFTQIIIQYTAPASSFNSTFFIYSIIDSDSLLTLTAQIEIELIQHIQPNNKTLQTLEDIGVLLPLSSVDYDGIPVAVQIVSLPLNGSLYDVDEQEIYNFYANGDLPNATTKSPIKPPYTVQNPRGVIFFLPPLNANAPNNQLFANFQFQWNGIGFISQNAFVNIYVTPVNDPPTGFDQNITLLENNDTYNGTSITLTSVDIDGSFTPDVFYRIGSFPIFGTLYELPSQNILQDIGLLPTINDWAQAVLNVSSEYSVCSVCRQAPVFDPNCISVLCGNPAYSHLEILGVPDVYPNYRDDPKAFEFSQKDTGKEFIELQFADQIFLSSIQVYETLNPGTIIKVSTAQTWNGTKTQWTRVWETAKRSYFTAAAPVVFTPSICPPQFKSQYVRLDFDTVNDGWNGYDAVQALGHEERLSGEINGSTLFYSPVSGIHSARADALIDSFTFFSSDCLSESALPATINLFKPVPQAAANLPSFLTLTLNTIPGTTTLLELGLHPILTDIAKRIGFTPSNMSLEIVAADLGTASLLMASNSSLYLIPGPFDSSFLVSTDMNQTTIQLAVWATVLDIVYRILVQIEMSCPTDDFWKSPFGNCILCDTTTPVTEVILDQNTCPKLLNIGPKQQVLVAPSNPSITNSISGSAPVNTPFSMAITSIPQFGTLYQVQSSSDGQYLLGKSIQESFATLRIPITLAAINATGFSSAARVTGQPDGLGEIANSSCTFAFSQPLYVESVEIYELVKTGTIMSVELWDASTIQWFMVWQGPATSKDFETDPTNDQIFTPRLCHASQPTQYVRISISQDGILAGVQIDAILLTGVKKFEEMSQVWSSNPLGYLLYVPKSNLHSYEDSFSYSLSTCPGGSSAIQVSRTVSLFVQIETNPLAWVTAFGWATLAIQLILGVASMLLIFARSEFYPLNKNSRVILLLTTIGYFMFLYIPLISILTPTNSPCSFYYWFHMLAIPTFILPICIGFYRHYNYVNLQSLKMKMAYKRGANINENEKKLQSIRTLISEFRMCYLYLFTMIPILIIAGSLYPLTDQYDYREGMGCTQGVRIFAVFTSYFFLSMISIGIGLYYIRNLPDGWGLRLETFYLLCYGSIFGVFSIFLGLGFPDLQYVFAYLFWAIPIIYQFRYLIRLGLSTLPFMKQNANIGSIENEFLDLLNTKRGYEFFLFHCESEFSPEHPLCWSAIESFKKKTSYDTFLAIYTTYISPSALLQVNISDSLRNTMKKKSEEFSDKTSLTDLQLSFDDVSAEIIKLMQEDSYYRFIHTPLFQKYKNGEALPKSERKSSSNSREHSSSHHSHDTNFAVRPSLVVTTTTPPDVSVHPPSSQHTPDALQFSNSKESHLGNEHDQLVSGSPPASPMVGLELAPLNEEKGDAYYVC